MSLVSWSVRAVFDDPPYSDPAGWTYTNLNPFCDTITFKRGRASEVDAIETGTSQVNLDNNDGRFTPGRAASPYYPGVVPRRRVMASITTSSGTFDLFMHLVERWPCELSTGLVSDSQVPAVDSFKHLGGLGLRAVAEEETLYHSPVAFWPLTEPAGNTSAANIVNGQPPAKLVNSSTGTADSSIYTFGEPGPHELAGSALRLLSGASSTDGKILNLKTTGSTFDLGNTAGWSVNVWMRNPVSSNSKTVFVIDSTSTSPLLLMYLEVLSTGAVQAVAKDGVTQHSANAAAGLANTNAWQMWTVVLNTAKTQLTLYRNGVLKASSAVGAALNWTVGGHYPNRYTVGGYYYDGTAPIADANYTISHVSVFGAPLTTAQMLDIHEAGSTAFLGENESERITRILDYIAWPAAKRNLQAGVSPLLGADTAGRSALAAVQDAAFFADGVLFMSGNDSVTYHNRHHRLHPTIDTTYSAAPSAALPVEAPLAFTMDDTQIVNDVTVRQRGGGAVRRINQPSIDAYGRVTLDVELDLVDENELTDRANWIITRYAQPVPRVEFARFRPHTAPALWDVLAAQEIGDRIRIASLPSTAPATQLDFIVEALEADIDEVDSEWRLLLSPAPTDTFWILDNSTYSVLGTTTKLAY